ncbi:hypothetical protein D3C73_618960 [compost metagenome]
MCKIRIPSVKMSILHDIDHFAAVRHRKHRFAKHPAEDHRVEAGSNDEARACQRTQNLIDVRLIKVNLRLTLQLRRNKAKNLSDRFLVPFMLAKRQKMHGIALLNEMDCNIFHFFIIEVVKTAQSFGGRLNHRDGDIPLLRSISCGLIILELKNNVRGHPDVAQILEQIIGILLSERDVGIFLEDPPVFLIIGLIGKGAKVGAHQVIRFAFVTQAFLIRYVFNPLLPLHKNRPANMHSAVSLIRQKLLHEIWMQLQLAEEVVDPPEQYRVGSIDL